MEDRKIIALYWQRDEQAIEETRKAYGTRLLALSTRILQNKEDSEETVNDTYYRAWQRIPPEKPNFFLAFLQKICRNLALDRLDWNLAAKRNTELVALTAELEQCIPDRQRDREWESRQMQETLEGFLKQLPKQTRVIFLRRYLLGDTVREIAQKYGMTESKVKMQLLRSREKLRTFLEQEGIPV